ncbi:glycosyltransferase family 4 protein [Thermanaerothrix sp.]|uniref:glycosyltransferase family 4 protein n=1 Tax=Thermanaerothrix sp. TaxID=2972675 RepID=UPI002ADDC96B|nr:glycosyltransferase family 4 protein [Thermanaerothrix sp.]
MARVLYFSRDYTPHDHRFLSALAATNHQVYYLRLERGARQLEDRPLPEGVTYVPWAGGLKPFTWAAMPALLRDFQRVLGEIKPDLIHAGPVQTAAFLAALSGFHPLVVMSWGSDLLRDAFRNRWWRWITTFTLRRATVLVGDCRAVQDMAISFGMPAERIVLFPWGVDLRHFSPGEDDGLRERRGWQDAFVLLSLRSWEPIYGLDVVVRAFAEVAHDLPEVRLFLLGGGSQAPLIQRLLYENDLLDRVYLGGQVGYQRLPSFYRAADLYLSASHSDGSSVSLMEALACGLPAVVSDIPGNREWVVPGVHGWLFPDGDAHALADRIREAYARRDALVEMRRQARYLAEERANWEKNFARLLQAYDLAWQIAAR